MWRGPLCSNHQGFWLQVPSIYGIHPMQICLLANRISLLGIFSAFALLYHWGYRLLFYCQFLVELGAVVAPANLVLSFLVQLLGCSWRVLLFQILRLRPWRFGWLLLGLGWVRWIVLHLCFLCNGILPFCFRLQVWQGMMHRYQYLGSYRMLGIVFVAPSVLHSNIVIGLVLFQSARWIL